MQKLFCGAALCLAAVAAGVPAAQAASFTCPIKVPAAGAIGDAQLAGVDKEINQRFAEAIGRDVQQLYVAQAEACVARMSVEPKLMAALAEAAGCAALVDRNGGCARYFDTEFGDPISVFMRMKKSAPARRQFEAAIAALPDPQQKKAALWCIQGTGIKK